MAKQIDKTTEKAKADRKLRIKTLIAIMFGMFAVLASLIWVNSFNQYMAGQTTFLSFIIISIIAVVLAVWAIVIFAKLHMSTYDGFED